MVASSEGVNGQASSWLNQKPGERAPSVMLVGEGPGPTENHTTQGVDGPGQTLQLQSYTGPLS